MKGIPKGKVMTYRQVAELAGKPGACRAVGNILNKNKDLKNIPCYRVVRSDGRVGGYRGGQKKKIALLKRDGVSVKNAKIVL
ncbi:MAG: MGMT family protein [Candidatus Pacebacteria bacterium]|nr:MGMT family protein [Candidatus Paceibacterota bacterium]